ncbi:MAG: DNA-3-methyladenine glycosylase [Chloroflexi bacterium]|nr:DNA-3-methyladenine glycosylase [Chloroflexota bacterium]
MLALEPLPRDFYLRPTPEVACDLLGRYLVVQAGDGDRKVGRIVETEAYVGSHDRASHSSRGRTPRTAPMFEEAGHAYVYFVYGMHWCINVVTEEVGSGCAVLLRALEPISRVQGPTNGPARLCRALGIDGRWNRADLTRGDLLIAAGEPPPAEAIGVSARIGVSYAGPWAHEPLRFFVTSSPHVSRYPSRARRQA